MSMLKKSFCQSGHSGNLRRYSCELTPPGGSGCCWQTPPGPREVSQGRGWGCSHDSDRSQEPCVPGRSGRRHWARPARGLRACGSLVRVLGLPERQGRDAGLGTGTQGRACLRARSALPATQPPVPAHPGPPLPHPHALGPPAPCSRRPQPSAPPPRLGGAAMALSWGCTHLHGRHSLGHFPAQRRLLVANLLWGQSLGPAPAPAVQPQALDAQLLRLRPC